MSRLQNCPVCGRIPKIHIYSGYRTSNEVTSSNDDWDIAETNAHNNWNNEVNHYNKMMCTN